MNSSLSSLLSRATLDDHEALLKASEGALKSSSKDARAEETKAIALLKLERYSDALEFFSQRTSLQKSIPEAYAYCLYRSGKFEEAVKIASEVNNSRGAQHVTLQAAYRAEDWDAATKAYSQLSKSSVAKEDFDLRVNKLALDAEALWLGRLSVANVSRPSTDDLSTFETAYNSACIAVSKGSLDEADMLLKRAINLCEHHEDLSDEDKAVELVPLKAQRLFVLERTKKTDEAAEIAKSLKSSLKIAAVDASTKRLAENNILTVTDASNPFLAHKTFHSNSIPNDERLFANQASTLASNERAIELQSFKYDGLKDATKKMGSTSAPSTSSNDLLKSMFSAAAHARGEINRAAISRVLPEFERRPNDVGLMLTVVQLYVLTGNTTAAVDLLHSFFDGLQKSGSEKDLDVRFSPGLTGLAVALYRTQGRQSQLKQELAKSASYWRTRSKSASSLLHAAGTALLESTNSSDATEAAGIFDKLYSQEPNDNRTIAGYIASHPDPQSSDVLSLASKLTAVSDLTRNIDIDALEAVGVPQSANALAIAQAGQSKKRAAVDGLSAGKKRVRKSRLPKDYDPNKKADPERWLPLRDRSTYKPRKKKGKRDDRTQGGGNVNESLDISNRPTNAASEVVTANTGGKKKKGKGKK